MFDHPEYKFIFNGISPEIVKSVTSQIEEIGILNTARIRGYQTENYQNLQVAGRLLIFDLRRHVSPTLLGFFEDIKNRVHGVFYDYVQTHHKRLQVEIDKSIADVYSNNDFFSFSSYKNNYLAKMSFDDEISEIPEYLFMRVAIQLHYEDGVDKVIENYHEFKDSKKTMASPTLFNSCMIKNHLISCFLGKMDDDLESILNTGVDFGLISKGCGAYGIDASDIRHSEINGGGTSSGLIPWLQIYNATARGCNQEGRRPGSMVVSLRACHIDVEDFIKTVQKIGDRYSTCHNLNISIYANQIFFDRVQTKGKWTLFCPAKTKWLNGIYGEEFANKYIETEKLAEQREAHYQKLQKLYDLDKNSKSYEELHSLKLELIEAKKNRIIHKVIEATYLYDLIISVQKMTGMPYLNSADSINYKCNLKNVGYVGNQNLCQEITIPSNSKNLGACNLASISLSYFAKNKIDRSIKILKKALCSAYDFKDLGITSSNTVWDLDNVITYSAYVLDKVIDGKLIRGKISTPNFRNRPIGMGAQGFDEALYTLDLRIEDDKDYVELLNKMIFACMYWNGMARSVILAIQKGGYETFKGSPLSEGKFQYDLWNDEFKLKGPNKFRTEEPKIIDPSDWEQSAIPLPNGDIILPTWNDLRRCVLKYSVRNSMLIACMPTATSSQILRNTETIEAPNAMLYSRTLGTGNYPVLIRHFVYDFEDLGLWNDITLNYLQVNDGLIKGFDKFLTSNLDKYPKFGMENIERVKFLIQKYKSMWDISQKYMLKLMADRSRYICHSASLNIYLANPSPEQLGASHIVANSMGLKTLMYYLRQKSSNTTIKFTVAPELYQLISKSMKESMKLEITKDSQPVTIAKKVDITQEVDTPKEIELIECDPNNKECGPCSS